MLPLPQFRISLLALAGILPATAEEKITYDDHVFPIFESSCLNCHNPDKKKGGLDLSSYHGTLAGGSGGKVVKALDGASSKLFTVSTHTEEPVMPPEGEKIDRKHANVIRAWIDGGLLETKSSRAKKPKKPAFSLAAAVTPQKRPDGPPPMPQDLLREPVVVTPRTTVVNDMEASPWAPLLAVTGQKQVLLYNSDTLTLEGVLPFPYGMPESLSFHSSGKYLIIGGGIGGKSGTTMTWEIETGKVIIQVGREFDSVLASDIHPDLGTVALGGPSRILKIWDTRKSSEIHRIKKHTDWITTVKYSPDAKFLATGDRNNGLQIWESNSGNEFHTLAGHTASIVDMKWRSDSKALTTASKDGHLILWDTKRGREIKKIKAHDGGTLSFDNSPECLYISSGRDKKVKLWKADLGFRQELPVFKHPVTEVEFSHDGKRFFTADWHGHIKAWSSESFKEIGTIDSNPPHISDRLVTLAKQSNEMRSSVTEKEKQLKQAEKWLSNLNAQLKKTRTAVPAAEKKIASLSKAKQAQEKALKKHDTDLHNLHLKRKPIDEEVRLDRALIKTLTEQKAEITDDALVAEHNEKIKVARDALDQRLISLQDIQAEWDPTVAERDKLRAKVKNTKKSLNDTKKSLPGLKKLLADTKKSCKAHSEQLAQFKGEFGDLNKSLAQIQHQQKDWVAADFNTLVLRAAEALSRTTAEKEELQFLIKSENTLLWSRQWMLTKLTQKEAAAKENHNLMKNRYLALKPK